MDRWTEAYGDASGAQPAVEEIVHEWFEQALVETVIGGGVPKGIAAGWERRTERTPRTQPHVLRLVGLSSR